MPKFIDITGQKFGEWRVIEYRGNRRWLCECSCGVQREVLGKTLRNGSSKSCGHSSNKLINMKGKQIGEWTVLEHVGKGEWLCKCSCGEQSVVHGNDLRNGKSKNCGHARIEKLTKRNAMGRVKLEGRTIHDWNVLD